MTRPSVWFLAAVPLLGGCLTASDMSAQKVPAPTSTQAQDPPWPTKTLTPLKTAAVPKPTKPIYPDIEALRGRESDQVTTLLGEPDFRRTDKPAELWQYRHDKCSVDLFLYPRAEGGLSIDFLDVRNYGDQNLSLQACFVTILKAKVGAGSQG